MTRKGAIMAALKLNEVAKPFSLPGVDDKTHSLSDCKDKEAVAVIFSCNHCPYVKAWEDRMVEIQSDYGTKGVQLVVINANDASKVADDSFPKMKERAKEKGFNFPYLYAVTGLRATRSPGHISAPLVPTYQLSYPTLHTPPFPATLIISAS